MLLENPNFLSIIFLIMSTGIIVKANNNIISNSNKVSPVVLNILPPKYISIICTIEIKDITIINPLFFIKFENKFILVVLALKALNIAKKINNPKNAVIKYLLLQSTLNNSFIKLLFKK